jgi:hypothetical protein
MNTSTPGLDTYRLCAVAQDLLDALQRLVHPMADDTDLDHAREVIARVKGQPYMSEEL